MVRSTLYSVFQVDFLKMLSLPRCRSAQESKVTQNGPPTEEVLKEVCVEDTEVMRAMQSEQQVNNTGDALDPGMRVSFAFFALCSQA